MIERILALAAAITVPAALRLLSLRRTLALCDAWPRLPGARATAQALARRVDRWLARGWYAWSPTCLTRALVLYTLLRQHGHTPRLHIGARGSVRGFEAHAWLSLGGIPVAEPGPSVAEYREVLVHSA